MAENLHYNSRVEFLTDTASYFYDKKDIYLEIKDVLADELNTPISMVRICGSAYWGHSFVNDTPFRPAESDLDVALINPQLFVACLSEVRQLTRNFSNLTFFRGAQTIPITFQDYAYKKGIIRVDLMPLTKIKRNLDSVSDAVSRKYINHFSKISFMIYDSEHSFTVKQMWATKKFRGALK